MLTRPTAGANCVKRLFNHLAALKGDPEVEQYFIGYFVDVETGYESDVLTDIANSFWG